jgi:hypothetical protein
MYRTLPLVVALALVVPAGATAQPPPAKIERVRVGYKSYREEFQTSKFKVGMWAPVYVEITAGPNGIGAKKPGDPAPFLEITTPDSEDVETVFRIPVAVEPNETQTFVGYTKPGNAFPEVRVVLHLGNRRIEAPPQRDQSLEVNSQLYVTLGRKVPDLPRALVPREERNNPNPVAAIDNNRTKFVGFEEKVEMLPEHWYGYDGVDLLFLSTDNKPFLELLTRKANAERLKALAQWVRRGGRLVVPVSWQTQDLLAPLLGAPVWQPPLPVVPPANPGDVKKTAVERLPDIEAWGQANAPFPDPRHAPLTLAKLDPGNTPPGNWDVLAKAPDGRPLVARVKYGLGQVVFFAFTLEEPAFTDWEGKDDFLRHLIVTLAPRAGQNAQDQQRFGRQGFSNDVTSQLLQNLDVFDVRVIPFGFVALFIVLYVLIVGPLDFIVLKYVFKRMEWTWVTFPTVVIGVSVLAYFAAYALKGQELKINKVDVVDFDLRTDADPTGQPRTAEVYGRTFFTILSPRIQSYTIGLEANPAFWGDTTPSGASADLMAWMGRPDSDAFGMARAGSQGFFRKPYTYRQVVFGLDGVPIPVWTTKAFEASWDTHLPKAPFAVNLTYKQSGDDPPHLTGTIRSGLGVELMDAWVLYNDECYPIPDGIPAARGDKKDAAVGAKPPIATRDWLNQADPGAAQRPSSSQGSYDPTRTIKQALFHSRLDDRNVIPNHSLRRLDLGQRIDKIQTDPRVRDRKIREAIVFGRVRFATGAAEGILSDAASPVPTKLWLGDLPGQGRPRPELPGFINQDTYVRVIVPVRPAGQ